MEVLDSYGQPTLKGMVVQAEHGAERLTSLVAMMEVGVLVVLAVQAERQVLVRLVMTTHMDAVTVGAAEAVARVPLLESEVQAVCQVEAEAVQVEMTPLVIQAQAAQAALES